MKSPNLCAMNGQQAPAPGLLQAAPSSPENTALKTAQSRKRVATTQMIASEMSVRPVLPHEEKRLALSQSMRVVRARCAIA